MSTRKEIIEQLLAETDMTYEVIAGIVGVRRQYIGQIAKRSGIRYKGSHFNLAMKMHGHSVKLKATIARRKAKIAAREQLVSEIRYLVEDLGYSLNKAAQMLNKPVPTIVSYSWKYGIKSRFISANPNYRDGHKV